MSKKPSSQSPASSREKVACHYEPATDKVSGGVKNRKSSIRRNFASIQSIMLENAIAEGQSSRAPQVPSKDLGNVIDPDVGLTLRELEEKRWSISPILARIVLMDAGLPYEGRRAGIIYSWPSIFKAEGISDENVVRITRISHPALFEHLLDSNAAAAFLGYRDSSSVRKLVASGVIPRSAYITFGSRGVFRFRPACLLALRRRALMERIV